MQLTCFNDRKKDKVFYIVTYFSDTNIFKNKLGQVKTIHSNYRVGLTMLRNQKRKYLKVFHPNSTFLTKIKAEQVDNLKPADEKMIKKYNLYNIFNRI